MSALYQFVKRTGAFYLYQVKMFGSFVTALSCLSHAARHLSTASLLIPSAAERVSP
jgi:hypothetical protein